MITRTEHEMFRRALQVGLGLGVALALSGEARAADPCKAFELTRKDGVVSYRTTSRTCEKGQDAIGTAVGFDDGWKVEVKEGTGAPVFNPLYKCDAAGAQVSEGTNQCFKLPSVGKRYTLTLHDKNDGSVKVGSNLETLIRESDFIGPPAPHKEDESKPNGTESKQDLWHKAYTDAVELLWRGVKTPRQELSFADWWKVQTHIEHRSDNRYVLFFTSDGQPISPLPQIDEDDLVVIAVVSTDPTKTVEELKIVTCDPAAPVRVSNGLPGGTRSLEQRANVDADHPAYQVRIVKNCDTGKGIVASTRRGDETASAKIEIPTLALYHFTVGLGFIYDFTRTVDYRAAVTKGENVPVIVKDEHIQGLTPGVLLVTWRPAGIDLKRSRAFWGDNAAHFWEWFGLTAGFNLTAPLDHFYFGGLIEPYPGVGVIGGAHFHTVKSLANGYQVGDRFSGGGDVPVDKRWDFGATSGYVGVSLDATLFAKLFSAFK